MFCCCLATKNVQSILVNLIVVFAFKGQLCIQTTSPTTYSLYKKKRKHYIIFNNWSTFKDEHFKLTGYLDLFLLYQ